MEFIGESQRITESKCPECGKRLDGCSGVNHNDQPKAWDVSICIQCASIAVFGEDLRLRKPTCKESTEFEKNAELMEAQEKMKRFRKYYSKLN